ncbi:MAG: hypothetical protein SGI73_07985 [Chloroflexota bacterium]|nr:hypothetical protein [Chloroflexota bacterium]
MNHRSTEIQSNGSFARQRVWIALTAILVLAAVTRILHIGQQALWIDEGATYFILHQPDLVTALTTRDHHPPAYYLMLGAWLGVMGDSVVAMRLFSALFSLLSVAAVVPLARAIHKGDSWFGAAGVPVLAALILALSDPEVVLAQDARMYALRTFLIILSTLFYIRWTRTPTTGRALAWILTNVLLYHVQYQGLYIAAVQGIHALIVLRGAVRVRAVLCLALSGLLFAPWFIGVTWEQRDNDTGIWAALPSNWNTFRELVYKFLSSQWAIMGALLLFGTVAWLDGRARVRQAGWTAYLWLWIALTVIVTFAFNLFAPVLAPHRILLITPALAILIARGLRNVPNVGRALIVGAIVVYGVTTTDDYYPKEPWDAMAANMARYAEPGELALLEVYRGDNPLTYYLDHGMPAGTRVESLRKWREYTPELMPTGILDVIDAYDTVWLGHWSPDQSAFDFLAQTGHVQTARLTTDHWGNALNVYRYDRVSTDAPLATFVNGMILLRAEVVVDPAADQVRVDLWWTADAPLTVDYSVSAFALNAAGTLVAQHDSFPFENARPTTTWRTGEIVYDPHPLPVDGLTVGRVALGVQLYTYTDGARYPTTDGADYLIVREPLR